MEQVEEIEVCEKDPKSFRVRPFLTDYEEAYRSFPGWDAFKEEIAYFEDGTLNVAYNAVDKHMGTPREDKVAVHFEAADGNNRQFTYKELSEASNKCANMLREVGIKRGDRVFLYLPRVPEVYHSFLGTLKTGAIAGTMFAAFGTDALLDRLGDSGACAVVTTPELKERLDQVRDQLPDLKHVIVVDNRGQDVTLSEGDVSWSAMFDKQPATFDAEHMSEEDYSFMLYTSGTTGKSKGVVHAHGDALQEHLTTKWVLDLHDEDMYWCTADHGWVTGVIYGILGPLSNGITQIMFEGRFDADAWYQTIEKYKVTVWYTAPTAIRMLMRAGNDIPAKYDLSSLRYLNSVGEPLNPEAVRWSMEICGLPFHDNWWQTETGSILIANYQCMDIKLGSMGRPFPGIVAAVVDDNGRELGPGEHGNLAIRPGWPAMLKTIWHNQAKYDEYFKFGWYMPGDKAYLDSDGYFWFIGRADDVIMTSGERVGPFEVESALVEHPAIAEAGVIGKPDMLRGEIIKAFVTLADGYTASDELMDEVRRFVKARLAGHAYPREIEIVDTLPKTQSGKIMRRVLKAREMGLPVGDTATMED
ncbi:MAG: acetate--CoA ligase [Actinobacteria bacterium]|nr:MAG: acetate--CoA ligase [Actinomycetota bacterium]